MLSRHAALIYTMVAVAESDADIIDSEINIIGDLVNHLPVFEGISRSEVADMAVTCSEQLHADGLDHVFALIREALPPSLREVAYALACDVVAADRRLTRDEMKILDRVRAQLDVPEAVAEALEGAARVRFQAA